MAGRFISELFLLCLILQWSKLLLGNLVHSYPKDDVKDLLSIIVCCAAPSPFDEEGWRGADVEDLIFIIVYSTAPSGEGVGGRGSSLPKQQTPNPYHVTSFR